MAAKKVKTDETADSAVLAGTEGTAENNPDVEIMLSEISDTINDLSGNTESQETVQVKTATHNLNEKIPCKSLFLGKLIYTSPTNGARYIWRDFGSVVHVPFSELETMNNHKPQFLNKPLIIILEASVVQYFNLSPAYEKVSVINRLEALFGSGDDELIRQKIREGKDAGQRDTIIARVRKMRGDNSLVNINIIRLLREELKFDFE